METVLQLFPHTPLEWIFQICISLIGAYVVVSVLEYTFHRFLMHQGLSERMYFIFPFLRKVRDHHRAHHSMYYKQFDYEPDPIGRDLNLRFGPEHFFLIMLAYLPLLVFSAFVMGSLVPVLLFLSVAILHYYTWNAIHVAMHHDDHPSWSQWRVYKYLARNHFLHHQDTKTRFNIVCPFADFVFGSWHAPTSQDNVEIERLGFLK